MAYFAQLDDRNIVIQVIAVSDQDCLNEQGVEDEAVGIAFCRSLFGPATEWAQTSFSGRIRKRFAGIGYIFDAYNQVFIPPKPFPSWLLDQTTFDWVAPVPLPTDGKHYRWDEETQSWVELPY